MALAASSLLKGVCPFFVVLVLGTWENGNRGLWQAHAAKRGWLIAPCRVNPKPTRTEKESSWRGPPSLIFDT